jgi:predicted Zn-dependent protease
MTHPIELLLTHLTEVFDEEASARLTRELQKISDVPTLLGLGKKYHDDIAGAPVLRRVLQLEPNNEKALETLGAILVDHHVVDEAEKVLEKLRRLYPNNATAYELTLALNDLGSYLAGMENWARKLRRLEPSNQRGVHYLAKLLAVQGQKKEALAELASASSGDNLTDYDRRMIEFTRDAIERDSLFTDKDYSWP